MVEGDRVMEAKVEARPVIRVQAPMPERDEGVLPEEEHEIKMMARDVNVYYGENWEPEHILRDMEKARKG